MAGIKPFRLSRWVNPNCKQEGCNGLRGWIAYNETSKTYVICPCVRKTHFILTHQPLIHIAIWRALKYGGRNLLKGLQAFFYSWWFPWKMILEKYRLRHVMKVVTKKGG